MKTIEERIAAARARADKLIGQKVIQEDREQKARRAAIAASIDEWLAELPEKERTKIFTGIEAKANTRNRKLIQGHPSRPENMPEAPAAPLN